MIVTTEQLFKVAYGKFAIGAYNINNAEQAMGLFKGAMAAVLAFVSQIPDLFLAAAARPEGATRRSRRRCVKGRGAAADTTHRFAPDQQRWPSSLRSRTPDGSRAGVPRAGTEGNAPNPSPSLGGSSDRSAP